ncbi:site-specific DNA-methyltransferase [Devosia sp. MC532]|uniref:site-specific DNA-methyltransferase n=1 Tax=Devosia sp. MC532 TaxID=2799788 RepID=UPI0018F635E3|nr:DNA methyltransferase [Devosia sp. MC532]MBJ7579304.1 site-specific DNA-methyltransferase [Devosia sp. MC532]
MSRLTDLIAQAKERDLELGRELEREFKVLSARRSFGLNFERHRPENVELPGRPLRKGDKVRVLPPRGSTTKGDQRLWKVLRIESENGMRLARLELIGVADPESASVAVDDLVVVAEFRDYIYPGLVSTGKVERGGDKPFHTVINGENFYALEALTYTHRGRIDAIYIDPPYNSGASDWKYNNNYVGEDDLYRHSKWLAFMERRLLVARQLLKPSGALIVTIDEHEVRRLGLLLEQTLEGFTIQQVTIVINPKGVTQGYLSRVEEYAFFCFGPECKIYPGDDDLLTSKDSTTSDDGYSRPRWKGLLRSGDEAERKDREQMFYPIWINPKTKRILKAGKYLPLGEEPDFNVKDEEGNVAVWPVRKDLTLGRWGIGVYTFNDLVKKGYVSLGAYDKKRKSWGLSYLSEQLRKEIDEGTLVVLGRDPNTGVADVVYEGAATRKVRTVWHRTSHDAGAYGTDLVGKLLGNGRAFPFPKSLYAVEDALRIIIRGKPDAVVLDFFSGSGTTAHAVMRLNRQDGGRRQSICVTNNEVRSSEQYALKAENLRPGDEEWERHGICEYITKPRIAAAITGRTPDDQVIDGDYKFTDTFPIADGFEENAEFFTLTYETPVSVSHNRAFARIAPLLWMRAGSKGRRIETLPDEGWEVVDTYGLLVNLDKSAAFCQAVGSNGTIGIVYIVTDDDRRFQSVVRHLPDAVEPVRLYESYLNNFRFSMGR